MKKILDKIGMVMGIIMLIFIILLTNFKFAINVFTLYQLFQTEFILVCVLYTSTWLFSAYSEYFILYPDQIKKDL